MEGIQSKVLEILEQIQSSEAMDTFKGWIEIAATFAKEHPTARKAGQTILFLFGLLTARSIILRARRRFFRYPPGPIGIPGFGCLIAFGGTPKKFLTDISVNYGDIVSVPLLQKHNIFINNANLAKDILRRPELVDHWHAKNNLRPIDGFDLLNGEEWRKRRQHASSSLFTIVNSNRVLQSTNSCINQYFDGKGSSGNNGIPIDGRDLAGNLSFNTLFNAAFGVTLDVDDKFIKDYVEASWAKFDSIGLVLLLDFSFNFKIPDSIMWNYLSNHRDNEKILDDLLIKWMKNNGYNVELNKNSIEYIGNNKKKNVELDGTFINSYLKLLNEKTMTADQIMADLSVLFSAGVDTISNTTHYGFVVLAKYPDIQEKVFNELKMVLNENGDNNDDGLQFNMKLLNKMHIFRAFLHEVLRTTCVTPTGVPHQLTQDITVNHDGNEYILPKDAIIQYNTFFILKKKLWHNDEKILNGDEENNDIQLDYWLKMNNETGQKEFVMNDKFILFGHGKRDCVGQSYVKRVLYAMFGVLISKYEFVFTNKKPQDVYIQQEWGLTQKIGNQIDISLKPR